MKANCQEGKQPLQIQQTSSAFLKESYVVLDQKSKEEGYQDMLE